MAAGIPADHPLRDLFSAVVERSFEREVGVRDTELTRYVSDVLVDFTHRDSLYRIRNERGLPIEQVAEMLVEGDVALNATSFLREREVHKHIGDFTLFWTGVYPEMLKSLRRQDRCDHLIDYVQQGRASYRIASTFDYGEYAAQAPVLRRLAERFEVCRLALRQVRQELQTYGGPETRAVQQLLA
jgi:hypothetical protein